MNEQYTPTDETMEGRVENLFENGGWNGALRLYEVAELAGIISEGGDFSSRAKQTELKKILRDLGAVERQYEVDGRFPRMWACS